LNKLESARYQTLYLDCRLEDLDFNEVLQMIESRHPQVRVVSVDSGGDPSESLSKSSGKAMMAARSKRSSPLRREFLPRNRRPLAALR
jgi:DNA-binding NtrC family response regulator